VHRDAYHDDESYCVTYVFVAASASRESATTSMTAMMLRMSTYAHAARWNGRGGVCGRGFGRDEIDDSRRDAIRVH
jgi:hypothetical protein